MRRFNPSLVEGADIMERNDCYIAQNYNAIVPESESGRPVLDIALCLTAISNYCKTLAKAYRAISSSDEKFSKFMQKAALIREENPNMASYFAFIDRQPIMDIAALSDASIARNLEETLKYYY